MRRTDRTSVSPDDWSARRLARLLASCRDHYPISDEYEARFLPGKHWWTSQREHVVNWLNELAGPGAFNRRSRGLGAKHFYTHFQCAPGLLWVAEALGEDADVVRQAADTAGGLGRPASHCAAVRSTIPWTRIVELLSNHSTRR